MTRAPHQRAPLKSPGLPRPGIPPTTLGRLRLLWHALAALLLSTSPALADAPWHAAGWSHRAAVTVTDAGTAGVDVAAVRIAHNGLAADDARDYRIFDAAGKRVPYLVTWHDPARDSLISFRSPQASGTYYVYFGNGGAPRDGMAATLDPTPGSGAPTPGPDADGWIPRAGLVLETMRRPRDADNPKTVEEMIALMRGSSATDGAAYRGNINDGINPFGDSDYYISAYRGWMRIPAAGSYDFCTASNEASFSFINGEALIHWPGRHTEQRGKFGEKHALHELDPGLHYVEYYHEEVLLYQVAFLGYKPPGGSHFVALPNAMFPQPHRAQVSRYETAPGERTVMIAIDLLDNVWPNERPTGQYTRYRLRADSGSEATDLSGWRFTWSPGDGQSVEGEMIEHIYLREGDYEVTLRATSPDGREVQLRRPVRVFPIEHLAAGFRAGDRRVYAQRIASYEAAVLDTPVLAEFVRFEAELGMADAAREHAKLALSRADLSSQDAVAMNLIAVGEAGKALSAAMQAAARDTAAHLKQAIEHETEPDARMRIRAQLIRVLGIELTDTEAAQQAYADAETQVRQSGMTRDMRAAFREATIALGDVHLYAGELDKASEDYRTAEALATHPFPPQVKAAKIGAYPEAIQQHLDANRLSDARAVVERWRFEFPADQLRGASLFYQGKIESLQRRPGHAIRPLTLAITLAQGAEFEAEARWLLALAHKAVGNDERYIAALRGLVASGLASDWRDQARAALEKLNSD